MDNTPRHHRSSLKRAAVALGAAALAASGIVAGSGSASAAGTVQTIPALQAWTTSTAAAYTFKSTSRIVVDSAYTTQLADEAAVLAEDIKALNGTTVTVVNGATPVTGDIVLSAGATDSRIKANGYQLTIGTTISVKAKSATDDGAFLGTRTVLQLLRQGNTVNSGSAVDWPVKGERGFMVDVGRKFMSAAWVKNHIREMSYLKLNYFHFHLTDYFGYRIDSASHPEVVSPEHYSDTDIAEIVALATKYHVTVVPELDVPGHMDWVLTKHPELRYGNTRSMDLNDPGTRPLVKDLLDEMLDLFPGPFFHIGADESNGDVNALHSFVNWLDDNINAAGKTTRMWADAVTTAVHNDIVIEDWNGGSTSPQALVNAGFPVFNVNGWKSYFTPGSTYWPSDRVKWDATMYAWDINQFSSGTITDVTKNRGTKYALWFDYPQAMNENMAASSVTTGLRVIAQLAWGSPKPVYTTFQSLMPTIGRAPGTNWPITRIGPVTGQATGLGGKCLDNSNNNVTDGNPIVLWTCNVGGSNSQNWTRPGDGTMRVAGKCLTIVGSSSTAGLQANTTARGTQLEIRTCGVHGGQYWDVLANGTLVNPQSKLCLDVPGSNSANGTRPIVWTCGTNQANQRWVVPV
ncbi:MAG TPA: family 20 glycosylhydrolase [Actinokineospora sp.]|nr:family 20 glycosylhydrolase [Actinokineospora sp.]